MHELKADDHFFFLSNFSGSTIPIKQCKMKQIKQMQNYKYEIIFLSSSMLKGKYRRLTLLSLDFHGNERKK